MRLIWLGTGLLLLAGIFAEPARALDDQAAGSICLMVESAARENALPVEFFARVIWRESRFNAEAVGPRTRSGAHAEGIAQFMPGTAAERQLLDPFDPVQALPKAAAYLHDLHAEFGNFGLAAAAYNAGPQRVRDWLAGMRSLPLETRDYVRAVTDRSADDWAHATPEPPAPSGIKCNDLIALLCRDNTRFMASLEQHVTISNAQPWGVQLAAGFSRDHALADYARIVTQVGETLGEHDPMITSGVLRNRGTRLFYQVRVGAQTRQEANDVCVQIHKAGGACMVLRTPRVGT
jgi:hypothetical protein